MLTNLTLLSLALIGALLFQPWRLLVGGLKLTPLLATLTLVPWLWAMPTLHKMPLQLQGSGACLVVLMLGWPLAVPVLCLVGVMVPLSYIGFGLTQVFLAHNSGNMFYLFMCPLVLAALHERRTRMGCPRPL